MTLTAYQQYRLLDALMVYRGAMPKIPAVSFPEQVRFERQLAKDTMREMLTILEASEPATVDSEVLEAMEKLQRKLTG